MIMNVSSSSFSSSMSKNGRTDSRTRTRRNHRGSVVLLLVSLLVLGTSGHAIAGGVVTTCTEGALRSAMSGGGVVTFSSDCTIFLTSQITIGADTTLDGA